MAKLYLRADGRIEGFDIQDGLFPEIGPRGPSNPNRFFELDPETNRVLVEDIARVPARYSVANNVLRKDGLVVPVAEEAEETQEFRRLDTLSKLLTSRSGPQDRADFSNLPNLLDRLSPAVPELTPLEQKHLFRLLFLIIRALLVKNPR